MATKMNIVGHCYRPSNNNDKVYMCCIRHRPMTMGNPETWAVLAKWGRRGKKLNVQSKGDFTTEAAAVQVQQKLWLEQQKGGYLDIESASYRQHMAGHNQVPLTMQSTGIEDSLEQEDGASQAAPSIPKIEWQCERCGKKFSPKVDMNGNLVSRDPFCPECIQKIKDLSTQAKTPGGDWTMICVDNTGMEELFDIGIEYICEVNKSNDEMIFVYDKMGRKDTYFRVRFITVEQWAKKQGKINVTILKNREPVPGAPKIEFAEFKPGDKIRITPPATPLEPRKHFVPAKAATMPTRMAMA